MKKRIILPWGIIMLLIGIGTADILTLKAAEPTKSCSVCTITEAQIWKCTNVNANGGISCELSNGGNACEQKGICIAN